MLFILVFSFVLLPRPILGGVPFSTGESARMRGRQNEKERRCSTDVGGEWSARMTSISTF